VFAPCRGVCAERDAGRFRGNLNCAALKPSHLPAGTSRPMPGAGAANGAAAGGVAAPTGGVLRTVVRRPDGSAS
jgi:hypothetical protein